MIMLAIAYSIAICLNILQVQSFEPIQVMCEVNGYLVPAIVDTGAEITVMSMSCAKRCQISSSIDTRFSGQAIGVGSSEIVGAIEDLPFRLGPIKFQNKISVLRSSRCDFLIGLDILRRFQCDISIGQKVLKMKVRNDMVRIPLMSGATGSHFSRGDMDDLFAQTESGLLDSRGETAKRRSSPTSLIRDSLDTGLHPDDITKSLSSTYNDPDAYNALEEDLSFDCGDSRVSMAGV
jgi:DNA damage-inducible protein 1